MPTIVVRLNPELLDNPDADIRYRLPDLLSERSGGTISDDGYDYVGDEPFLVLFLKTSKPKPVLACVIDVVENVRVLDNDLRQATVIAVKRKGGYDVVYPPDFAETFLPE
jgi:hypothetical protein